MQTLYIIAGPNGAGKTTFALRYLAEEAHISEFVNADIIAQESKAPSPVLQLLEAGRLTLERISRLIAEGRSFAWETTMSGRSAIRWIKAAKKAGYFIKLTFLWIASAEQSIERVHRRMAEGGHPVEETDLRRRFLRSVWNFFHVYSPCADAWKIYDNSQDCFRLIAVNKAGRTAIRDQAVFNTIAQAGGVL